MKLKSSILKLALFATGLSGIVAEYSLSTLATYFLGDSVFQWAMIVSVMLFSMGLGARFSKFINGDILRHFVIIELLLSVLVSYSTMIAYLSAGYTIYTGFIIYALSILIGLLIGLEIPLVVRLNEEFESLNVNIASVLEKDYLGSLAGGLFFAFVGLPYLGLTYTPFLLGSINLAVAILLFVFLRAHLSKQRLLTSLFAVVSILVIGGFFIAKPVILHGEQKRYKDKVVYEEQSRYQKLVLTQWQDEYWLFINGNQQFSTLDETKYHEPLVHPIMQLVKPVRNVLLLGGGDGCAVREILKYKTLESITLVDLDPAMTDLGKDHPVLREVNDDALHDARVAILNEDGFNYLEHSKDFFDVIIIDLPDPKTVELNRLYTHEFYSMCHRHLRPNGALITQAGSPYYSTQAFECIDTTMTSAGFATTRLHNQVLTLGEWGWIIGSKNLEKSALKSSLQSLTFTDVETDWINHEAMLMMTSFGKNLYFEPEGKTEVNRIHNPVLYRYYLKGNWDLY